MAFFSIGGFLVAGGCGLLFGPELWAAGGGYALAGLGAYALLAAAVILRLSQRPSAEQEEVEKKVSRLETELARSKRLESLGTLAGATAHDLNNILSGIATYPEVLMLDKHLAPATRQGLEIIRDSGEQASNVVRDLLTISQVGRAVKEEIDLNRVLERYLVAHGFEKIRAKTPEVALDIESESGLPRIEASYFHVEQALEKLLMNAFEEAAQRQDGRVTVTTINRRIKEDACTEFENRRPGEYAVLSVADNGPGIVPEKQASIFEPFFTKKQMGKDGTGLGLALVQHTVEDHGGFVELRSDENGTCFDLFFPTDFS